MTQTRVSIVIQISSAILLLIGSISSFYCLQNQISFASDMDMLGSDVMDATDLDSAKLRLSRSRDKLARYTTHHEFMSQIYFIQF